MWVVLVYGGERVLVIPCESYHEALQERDVRGGMGYVVEIEWRGFSPVK